MTAKKKSFPLPKEVCDNLQQSINDANTIQQQANILRKSTESLISSIKAMSGVDAKTEVSFNWEKREMLIE